MLTRRTFYVGIRAEHQPRLADRNDLKLRIDQDVTLSGNTSSAGVLTFNNVMLGMGWTANNSRPAEFFGTLCLPTQQQAKNRQRLPTDCSLQGAPSAEFGPNRILFDRLHRLVFRRLTTTRPLPLQPAD